MSIEQNIVRNRKVMERAMNTWENDDGTSAKKMRESFKRTFGFEMDDQVNFPVLDGDFNFAKAHRKMIESGKFQETETLSSKIYLTRAGIQNIANNAYILADTSFEKWVTVTQSKKKEELYAPIQGLQFPGEVPAGGLYPELSFDGLNTKIENKKYGSMFSFELELGEDDQTSQIYQMSRTLGEYMKILWEVLVQMKLASASATMTYGNLTSPSSETAPSYESYWPWATSAQLFKGGGWNALATSVVVSQSNLQSGFQQLMSQKNLLGLQMGINANMVLSTPANFFDLSAIANSTYWATNLYNSSGPGAASAVGGPMVGNILKGMFEPVFSPWMVSNSAVVDPTKKMWYILDSSKPFFILQVREPTTVINENPASGQSFERDVVRFKARQRGNADFIDPRFIYQGNNGSV